MNVDVFPVGKSFIDILSVMIPLELARNFGPAIHFHYCWTGNRTFTVDVHLFYQIAPMIIYYVE